MKTLIRMTCLVTALFAPAAEADWEGNWLLGASGAYNWRNGNVDFDLSLPALSYFDQAHLDFNTDSTSWGVFGGYQIRYRYFLIGAELNAEWENNNHMRNYLLVEPGLFSGSATANYKREPAVALTGRFGYQVCCWGYWLLPYIRAGIETSYDKLDILAQATNGAILDVNDSKRFYRFVGGIGAETPIPILFGLTFRAEYNYHSNSTLNLDSSWILSNVPIYSAARYRTHTNSAKAALVYNFFS